MLVSECHVRGKRLPAVSSFRLTVEIASRRASSGYVMTPTDDNNTMLDKFEAWLLWSTPSIDVTAFVNKVFARLTGILRKRIPALTRTEFDLLVADIRRGAEDELEDLFNDSIDEFINGVSEFIEEHTEAGQ